MQLRIEKRMVPHIPWGLVFCVLAIAGLGVWNLASASRPPHAPVWSAQALYIGVGLFVVLLVCLVDYRWIQRMALPIYLANIAALIALRFIGHKAKGAESWFVVGPFRIQPAEFMKIGVLLMLAKVYHDDYRPHAESYGLVRLWKPALVVGVPTLLVLVQPDLGTALMIILTAGTVILFGKVRWYLATVLVAGVVLVGGVIWNDYIREQPEPRTTVVRHLLKPHQSQRISAWLDPESDLRGKGYHAAQSKIAVGSGGLTGKGWREGTQTGLFFLPEQHTDFIFSVWAEEHGFLLCLTLVALYGLVFVFALGVGFNARDRFGAFLAVGVTASLFWQVFENIGMVIGLLPVTGITLPLLSYGGSSMLTVMISIGLLVNVSMRRHMF
ncbi:rod shape-determining protein RodA [Aggregicoccus sp. 17bor-14]|uniref:rod shape-determining protein RodA n=1 Tax=Myxococcaceae TaxID=31 RepID=UPI00129CE266|nr:MULTISPECIES: rod shape-determining protein RodA [Myxococcaceae]MBF5041444.1 rod shape-determining protein RodA [Simulacricoccus sp. 17bor-14]MRI87228.1 rod shape-determining protein RodA [Aggregicoccus sp. 17bor-14]